MAGLREPLNHAHQRLDVRAFSTLAHQGRQSVGRPHLRSGAPRRPGCRLRDDEQHLPGVSTRRGTRRIPEPVRRLRHRSDIARDHAARPHGKAGELADRSTGGSALSVRGTMRVPASHRRSTGGYDRHDAWHPWGPRLARVRSPRPGGVRMNEPDLFSEDAKPANENPARPRAIRAIRSDAKHAYQGRLCGQRTEMRWDGSAS